MYKYVFIALGMPIEKKIETPLFDGINPVFCINAKLRKLHRLVNSAYMLQFKPYGLKGSMTSILFVIGKRPGINQKFLADMLVLDQSTMSRDLKRLMDRNLILAIKSTTDPRNKELQLTEEGYKLVDTIAPLWQETHQRMESVLEPFQIEQIDGIIQAVQENLEYLKETPSP